MVIINNQKYTDNSFVILPKQKPIKLLKIGLCFLPH